MTVHFSVNNKPIQLETAPDRRLLDILREDLLLTGTKEGCSEGECGACTVLLDNEAVHACLILAIQLEGCHITTIEGLAASGELDALQKAFIDEIAIQCGFCTPGFILTATEILNAGVEYTDDELRKLLSGHLCRCTGYKRIIEAIEDAAERMNGGAK